MARLSHRILRSLGQGWAGTGRSYASARSASEGYEAMAVLTWAQPASLYLSSCLVAKASGARVLANQRKSRAVGSRLEESVSQELPVHW